MQRTLRRKKRPTPRLTTVSKSQLIANLKRLMQGLSCVFVFFAVGYLIFWCLDPAHFPITSVRFVGERKHISQASLREVIASEVKKGFFKLKVSTLHRQLLSLPWIKQAEIRRVWPDQLLIHFEEHRPAVRWGEVGFISITGTLFYPELSSVKLNNFPVLVGPEGKSTVVWQQYLIMKEVLAPLNLRITQLVLAPRGAWHLQLSNGMTVILGTHEVLPRLQRFIQAYKKHLSARQPEVAYVDLRYASGMAVGWKSGLSSNE